MCTSLSVCMGRREAQDQGLKIFSVGRSTEGGQEAGMNGRRGTTKAIMQSGPGGQSVE